MSVAQTPDQVSAFRLLSIRAQLRLEKMGMKSSGGALRPRLAKEFGLASRDPHDKYIAHIETKLAEIRQRMGIENAKAN
jgi:hypothetical protein